MSGQVGAMNERIILLQQVATISTTDGSSTSTYPTLDTVWAERVLESSKESMVSDKLTLDTHIKLRIWFRTDIKPNYRVTYREENYRIIAIKELERKVDMELTIAILD